MQSRKSLRLQKIEIFGFKSFADKTLLEFHPGITAIVGPNGCGKSNISDAFRWVLGEQSAKSMRGHKMDDVINAGTTQRKPLNFAEVTITLDNEGGLLPIEFAEVSITRRLHRSGESNYFINKHPVRYKDIQSLFLDSGMGKNAYSNFEQGKMDQIINYTALERRSIFEEAAGILRFLQRKREALRKLEDSENNLLRVRDIHQEVEKQIIVLEEQAEKARVYKENKIKLEAFEKSVFVLKWENLQKKGQDICGKEQAQQAQAEEMNLQIKALQDQLNEAKKALWESEKILRTKNEDVFKTRGEKEMRTRERLTNQERLKEAAQKERRWQNELEAIIEKRKSLYGESQSAQKQQKSTEKELLVLEKTAKSQREKVSALETEIGKLRIQQQAVQQELLKLVQSENQIESELKQNSVRLENNQERREHLGERQQKLSALIGELAHQVSGKKDQLDEFSEILEGRKATLVEQEERLASLSEEIQKNQDVLEGVQQELSDSNARQKVLVRLREEMEGFSSGSKKLLQEAANKKGPLYNKLKGIYEYIVPEAGGEAALAVMMRPYGQTLVVGTKKDFDEVVAYAHSNKLKDFSLICLENLPKNSAKDTGTGMKGVKPLLDKIIDGQLSEYFLQQAFTVDATDTARKYAEKNPGVEVWSDEGVFIDRFQVVFYTTQSENNVFLREAELKGLEKKLTELEDAKQQLESHLKGLQQKRIALQGERIELDKLIRREEMKLVELNFALQRANADLEKYRLEDKQLGAEIRTLDDACEKLTALLKELQKSLVQEKSKGGSLNETAANIQNELEQRLSVYKHDQRDLQDKEAAYQKVSDDNRKLLHALNVLEVKDTESKQQEKRLEEEIQSSREMQAQFKIKSEEMDAGLQDVEKVLVDVMSICDQLEADVHAKKKSIDDVEKVIVQAQQRLKHIDAELYQTGMQKAQNESTRASIENELQERYHLTIEEAKKMAPIDELTLEQMEKSMRSLRYELDAAGDINMTSIEEFDKHKIRYEFLNQQMDDLSISKQELIGIITQLDGESRKIFKDTFELIRINFKKNFKILFNGGEADLEFTETEDVLEAGIEIIAKPPGKQMRSINLLSGGEKCLTAMALLFAIFEVKPAPFCILDEIDAPLDDSNVERFVNVVKQFIDRCQFIIITHNKRTMAIADRLFGVSMEERGVSKLLSIEFSKNYAAELV